MTEQERGPSAIPPVEEKTEPAHGELYDMTRRVLLAGIGAAALAYDEATAFVDRLVERGELARGEARELMSELSTQHHERVGRVRSRVRGNVEQALEMLDLPRRGDLDALQRRIDALNARVEALLREKEGQGQ
jgi:poly(hydroxyalkanoate) granule-associated protein